MIKLEMMLLLCMISVLFSAISKLVNHKKAKIVFVCLSTLSIVLWFAVYLCDIDFYNQYVGSIFAKEESIKLCNEDNYDVRKSKAKETIKLFYANSPELYYAENAISGIYEGTSDNIRNFILDENVRENDIKICYSQNLTLDTDGNICIDVNNPATNDVMIEYSVVLLDNPDELFYRTGVVKPGEYLYEAKIETIPEYIRDSESRQFKAIIGVTLFSSNENGQPTLFSRYVAPEQMTCSPHVFSEKNISLVSSTDS